MALYLDEHDVAELLTVEDCMAGLEAAFARQDAGLVLNHPRRRLRVPRGTFHFMEAADLGLGRAAMKAYASFRPATRFLVLLYETETGTLLALVEGNRLGQVRTGAATGVATRHMARADAATLALFGAGWQAETQALAVTAARPLTSIRIYSRTPQSRTDLASRMAERLGLDVRPVSSPAEALDGADVVVTATTARTPVFDGKLLAPGTHVNAVGSNAITKAEVDAATVERASRIVVDSVEQARAEAGDLLGPSQTGTFRWEQAHELREVVAGRWPGRENAEEITLFKSIGVALEDVVAASIVYDKARAAGAGRRVPLWE